MLAAAILALSSAAGAAAVPQLEMVMDQFDRVCVANEELSDQRAAANALTGAAKTVISRYDSETRQERVPETRYEFPGYAIRLVGDGNGSTCLALTDLDPNMDAQSLADAFGARFGGKPRKEMSRKGFYHGGWNTKKRTFDIEWKQADGKVIALLSIRRREGFYK